MDNGKLQQEAGDNLNVSFFPVVSTLSVLVVIGLVKVNFKFLKSSRDLARFPD